MGRTRAVAPREQAVPLLLSSTGVVVARAPVALPQLVHPQRAEPSLAPSEPEPVWPEESRPELILAELDRLDIELRRSRRLSES